MRDEIREKRKAKRKRRRVFRFILNLLILALVLYLATLAVSIFGDGDIPGKLREYDFISAPAEYIEETFNLKDEEQQKDAAEAGNAAVEIRVREDAVYFGEQQITVEDLQGIISDSSAQKAVLIDDSAKRVTYSQVYDELQRLGVIIEEK